MSKTPDSPEPRGTLFRRAVPEDAPVLRAIAEASGIDAWTTEQYQEEILSGRAIAVIAARDSEALGFVLGRTINGNEIAAEGEIYNIAVHAPFRRTGIGRTLLAEAVRVFSSDGCRKVWLEVRAGNETAIQFYENNGFSRTSIRKLFYSNPVEDAVIMRLDVENYRQADTDRFA